MDEPSATSDIRTPTRLLISLAVGFGIFHALTLLLAILPHDWAINRLLAPYRQLTGTGQEWGMFYTIPTMQENAIAVDVA